MIATKSTLKSSNRRSAVLAVLCIAGAMGCTSVFLPPHDWSEEWGPMVPHDTFPGDCGLCHVPETWSNIRPDFFFDHTAETGYKLEGAHADAQCLRCHNDRGPVAAYLARGCGGCHSDPHKSALGLECSNCHNQFWWEPDGLVLEHAKTNFPLVASHALAPCEACHERATSGDFRGTPTECHFCHQEDALLAQPNHVVNQWVTGCEDCHDVGDWGAADFKHLALPLVGGHANVECTDCHVGGLIAGTPTDCFFCHQNDYANAPNHVTDNLSTDCTECHDVYDWTVP